MKDDLDDVRLNPKNKYLPYEKEPLHPADIVVFLIILAMLIAFIATT